MTDTVVASSPPSSVATPRLTASRPFLPLLVVLFIGSGCAALIYEIVWLQMLGLEIGASAISLGVLLGTFMGGMCIGSLLFPRLVPRNAHPLLVYGMLEAAIGVIALLEIWLIPAATGLYVHFAASEAGAGAIAWRAVISGICLLPPTVLMGATLPAIARYVETSRGGVSWMGFFYGGNIVGAVIGCMWAGFYLLPNYDARVATYVAMGINGAVATLAIILSSLSAHSPASQEESTGPAIAAPGAWAVYFATACSGLTGLGAEVVWTRQLSLMLGATVYTFSNILAVFLLGLGIGSSVGAFVARSAKNPKAALAWCQLLLTLGIGWAAYSISFSLPFWPENPYLAAGWPGGTSYTFQLNLAACFWALLPSAVLWGASFPIALAAMARRGQDPGRLVGGVYAANTVGAIVGSLLFSLIFMRYLGSQVSQQILMAICIVSGIVAVIPVMAGMGRRQPGEEGEESTPGGTMMLGGAIALAVVVALGLTMTVGGPNWGAVAWGRFSAYYMGGLYPAVLGKTVPLTDDEKQVLKEANDLNFKTLRYSDNGIGEPDLAYSLDKDASQDKVNAWLAKNKKTLMSALHKQDQFADEYKAVRDANVMGLRGLTLDDNGNLKFDNADAVPEEAKRWLQDKNRAADLASALRKRQDLTGLASILPYQSVGPDAPRPDRYCVYVGEGMNVSVAVTYDEAGYRYFHGAGKVQASSNPMDMRLQRSLGHISVLTNYAQTGKTPQDVLVVACGAGVTAGSFVPYGANITIVDIEDMVPRYVTPQFWDVNHDVIPFELSGRPTGYKKTHVIIDDGRHYIKTAKKKFDVITSDPIDPWVKGCAALNTIEYYQMCKEHLNPGGVMALWIPLYESSEQTSKSIIATFFKVFPNGIIWANDDRGAGYDCVLFGSVDTDLKDKPLNLDIEKIQDYIDDPDHAAIKQSLQDVKFGLSGTPGTCEAVDLLATYAGTASRMKEWSKEADDKHLINTDANLRLQYVAGLGVNNVEERQIFSNILKYYSFAPEVFAKGSEEHMAALKQLLRETGRIDKQNP